MAIIIPYEGTLTQGCIVDNIPWSRMGVPLQDNRPLGIVLTNACDFEHGHASFFTIAALVDAKDTIFLMPEFRNKIEGCEDSHQLQKKAFDSLKKWIEGIVHNKSILRYFFLIQNDELETPDFLVDFQNTITFPIEEKGELSVIAKLQSPYLEKMVVHYSSYISRIGVARINQGQVDEVVNRIISPFEMAPKVPKMKK
jgi:hypothetical protein